MGSYASNQYALNRSQEDRILAYEKDSFTFLHSEVTAFRFKGSDPIEKG